MELVLLTFKLGHYKNIQVDKKITILIQHLASHQNKILILRYFIKILFVKKVV